MQLEARKYLHDIDTAVDLVLTFTAEKSFTDYSADAMLRSAVERQFEIMGEALGQLAQLDPELAAGISDFRRIIASRNILIHGYAQVDDRLVWDIVETMLPGLRRDVTELLLDG